MRRMSMMPFRVLCLLAIVLYCVGVANANANAHLQHIVEMVKKTQKLAEETSKLKEECEKAGMAAEGAARKASTFVLELQNSLQELAAKPTEVAKKKEEGEELIKIAEEAAKKARAVGEKTTDSETATQGNATFALGLVQSVVRENEKSRLDAEFANTEEKNAETICENAIKTADDASRVVHATGGNATEAEEAAKRVKDVLQKLEAAVAAAGKKNKGGQMKQKEKKQAHSQLADKQGKSMTTIAENANGAQAGSSEVCIVAEDVKAAVKEVKNAIKKLEEQAGSNEVCIDAEVVNAALKEVKNAIKKLEAAVAAADGKKVKLKVSQAQSQTRDPTVAGQQEQRSGNTITVNIRGENLDALFNDGKNKSGMALQDGSSIPALLRVPLLLLLLFSVLGCMTVC